MEFRVWKYFSGLFQVKGRIRIVGKRGNPQVWVQRTKHVLSGCNYLNWLELSFFDILIPKMLYKGHLLQALDIRNPCRKKKKLKDKQIHINVLLVPWSFFCPALLIAALLSRVSSFLVDSSQKYRCLLEQKYS